MTPLGDLVVDGELSYGVVQPGEDTAGGVPIVRVKDLDRGCIQRAAPMRVRPEIASMHRRTLLRGGELLVSIVGTVGEVAVVPMDMAGWNVARAIAVIRPKDVSAAWLKCCLESADVRSHFHSMLNTTVQSTLNLADLRRLRIPMPPERVRQAIVEVLGALEDKIAANSHLVSLADELAALRFEQLLVEPPDVRPLSTLASFVNGKAFTKDATGTGRMVLRIAELNSGIGGSTVYNDIEVADQYLARPGDLLFAWSGSLTVHRWYRPEAIINQHIFKVIPTDVPMWVVNSALRRKLADFKATAADKATTMGHIQRHHLDEPVMIPGMSTIATADDSMTALWDRALLAEQESLKLAEIRDVLLPELMSGRIRVRDAEKTVSEAV